MRGFALGTVAVGLVVAVLGALLLTPGPAVAALLWPVLVSIALGVAVLAVVVRRRHDVLEDEQGGGAPSPDPFGLLGDPRAREAADTDRPWTAGAGEDDQP